MPVTMFNTSTRKDDLSLKLRSQNLRNAKQQTKALEAESRHMEDRLQELKIAMTREKEERKAQGSGFWQKGQTGNLSNYAEGVLKKPKKEGSASSNREKSSKKIRVKVLKDEPIIIPERNKAPGTMANIAQRNLLPNREKIKGPKCGQCEQKAANVSCQECGEDYCAGCFAAFHLRGALKKHRSVPIGGAAMRPNMTARTTVSENKVVANPDDDNYRNRNYEVHDRPDPAGPASAGSDMLLAGEYDEQANAAEFAAALVAWRTGKPDTEPPASPKERPKPRTIGPRTGANRKAIMDSGTSMQEVTKPVPEIKFKSSLTYAERLLLKKHRRTELEEFEGHVTLDDVIEMMTPRNSPSGFRDPFQESAHALPGRQKPVYHTTHSHLVGELGSRQGAYEEPERSESRVSVIMVSDDVPANRLRGYEQSSNYDVEEGPDGTRYPRNQSSISPDGEPKRYAFATPPTSGRPSPTGRRSASLRRSYTVSPVNPAARQTADKENTDTAMTLISQRVLLQKGGEDSSSGRPPTNSGGDSARTLVQQAGRKERPVSRTKTRASSGSESQPGSARPGSTRPGSARVRSARPGSARPGSARPGSTRPGSARPSSRARSRTYMYGEGLLTKAPSDSLKVVARLAGQEEVQAYHAYQEADLSTFFTAGVKPMPVQDRVLTPRGQRKKPAQQDGSIKKWKVSNQVYTMSTRSWRPGSSLGDSVDPQQVNDHFHDTQVAALEKMSDDVMDEALTSRDDGENTLSWCYSEDVLGSVGHSGEQPRVKENSGKREVVAMTPKVTSRPATPSRHLHGNGTEEPGSLPSRPVRERSLHIQEKRDQAFQQSEDLVPAELSRPPSDLRLNPVMTSGSRPGTPRNRTPRNRTPLLDVRNVSRPDSGRPGSRTPLTNRSGTSLHAIPASPVEGSDTGRVTPPAPVHSSRSGRTSQAIEIDGDDLAQFDELAMREEAEDEEAIGQLEWELASLEGRLTADGRISQMLGPEADMDIPEDTSSGDDLDSPNSTSQEALEQQIRESVLMGDFAEMEDQFMADEVAALQ